MTLTARDEQGIRHMPNGEEVVLSASDDVFAIWRPADAEETAVIGVEVVQEPVDKVMSVDLDATSWV